MRLWVTGGPCEGLEVMLKLVCEGAVGAQGPGHGLDTVWFDRCVANHEWQCSAWASRLSMTLHVHGIPDTMPHTVPAAVLKPQLLPLCAVSLAASQVGAQARLMSQGLRKLCGSCAASKTTIIFINQLRQKVGDAEDGTPSSGSCDR